MVGQVIGPKGESDTIIQLNGHFIKMNYNYLLLQLLINNLSALNRDSSSFSRIFTNTETSHCAEKGRLGYTQL